jgi:hypothetical protein
MHESMGSRGTNRLLVQILCLEHAASMRAISAAAMAARFSKVSGLCSAQIASWRWWDFKAAR